MVTGNMVQKWSRIAWVWLVVWFLAVNHCVLDLCQNDIQASQQRSADPCSHPSSHSGCSHCYSKPISFFAKITIPTSIDLIPTDNFFISQGEHAAPRLLFDVLRTGPPDPKRALLHHPFSSLSIASNAPPQSVFI
jgi:hypothetical protein